MAKVQPSIMKIDKTVMTDPNDFIDKIDLYIRKTSIDR